MSDERIRAVLKAAFERSHEPPIPGFAERLRSVRLNEGARAWRFRWSAVVAIVLAGALIAALLLSRPGLSSRPAPPRATPIPPTPAAFPSPSPTATPTPFSGTLQMVDAQHGWLFAATRAYRTTDAGRHWTDAGPIPGTGSAERGATAWGTEVAWLVLPTGQAGSDVYRTIDAGASWQQIGSVGGVIGAQAHLTFVDSQHGWALGNQNGASSHEWVDLFGTSDGGRTWQHLAATPTGPGYPAPGPGQLSTSCDKTGMTFVDPLRGWITEFCDQATEPFLYRTTDGGHTWYPQQLPEIQPHREITLSSAVFLDRSFGVLTASQGTLTVYTTSDGGATWKAAAQIPGGSDVRPVPITPRQWVLVSGPDQLTMITNGQTTTIQAAFGPQGVRQLWFGDALHGLAITGDARLLRTDDGGHTWSPVQL